MKNINEILDSKEFKLSLLDAVQNSFDECEWFYNNGEYEQSEMILNTDLCIDNLLKVIKKFVFE